MRYSNSLVLASLLLLVVDVHQSGLAQDNSSAPPIEFLLETIDTPSGSDPRRKISHIGSTGHSLASHSRRYARSSF